MKPSVDPAGARKDALGVGALGPLRNETDMVDTLSLAKESESPEGDWTRDVIRLYRK